MLHFSERKVKSKKCTRQQAVFEKLFHLSRINTDRNTNTRGKHNAETLWKSVPRSRQERKHARLCQWTTFYCYNHGERRHRRRLPEISRLSEGALSKPLRQAHMFWRFSAHRNPFIVLARTSQTTGHQLARPPFFLIKTL